APRADLAQGHALGRVRRAARRPAPQGPERLLRGAPPPRALAERGRHAALGARPQRLALRSPRRDRAAIAPRGCGPVTPKPRRNRSGPCSAAIAATVTPKQRKQQDDCCAYLDYVLLHAVPCALVVAGSTMASLAWQGERGQGLRGC